MRVRDWRLAAPFIATSVLGATAAGADLISPLWIFHNGRQAVGSEGDIVLSYDATGSLLASADGFTISETIGAWRAISSYLEDGALIADFDGGRLVSLRGDGQERFAIAPGAVSCVDSAPDGTIFAAGGCCTTGGTLYKIDGAGKVLKTTWGMVVDIAVDAAHSTVWTLGQSIQVFDLDLNLLATHGPLGWSAVSVDLEPDGTAWIAERRHPELPASVDRLLHLTADGQLLAAHELPYSPSCVRRDGEGNLWLADWSSLHKHDPAGQLILSVDGIRAFSITIYPSGRGLWVGCDPDVRYFDLDGRLLVTLPSFDAPERSWVCIRGGGLINSFKCLRNEAGTVALSWDVRAEGIDAIELSVDGSPLAGLPPTSTTYEAPNPGLGVHTYVLRGTAAGEVKARVQCIVYEPHFHDVSCDASEPGKVVIHWSAPDVVRAQFDSVEVLRDREAIATLRVDETTFVDNTPRTGKHDYCLSPVRPDQVPESRDCCEALVSPKPIESLSCESSGTRVRLSWSSGTAYDAIEVDRDGMLIQRLPGSAESFDICPGGVGFHDYSVRGLAVGFASSLATCTLHTPEPLPLVAPGWCEKGADVLLRWELGDCYSEIEIIRDGSQLARLEGTARSFRDSGAAGQGFRYSISVHVGDFRGQPQEFQFSVCSSGAFLRGDANMDAAINLTDAITTLGHLFLGSPVELGCEKSADVDDSGALNISDAIALLGYLFLGGDPPPAPFPECGLDARPDALGCAAHGACLPGIEPGAGRVITWGNIGILFRTGQDNLKLYRNILLHLAEGREMAGEVRILYTAHCDPRTDPTICHIGTMDDIRAFLDLVDSLGRTDFSPIDEVNLREYSLVIADFCGAAQGAFNTDAELDVLSEYIATGGRVWVVADNFCFGARGATAAAATEVLGPLGLRFTAADPAIRDPLLIPPEQQIGLLDGVQALDIWRVAPQVIDHSFQPVVESPLGVLGAILEQ